MPTISVKNATDLPLSIIVYDDAVNKKGSEVLGQGDGAPRGRELEIADLLRFIKTAPIRNSIWRTVVARYRPRVNFVFQVESWMNQFVSVAFLNLLGVHRLFWGSMKKSDVTCSKCRAAFQRLELDVVSVLPTTGEYCCPVCERVVERFNGTKVVAYRLAMRPSRLRSPPGSVHSVSTPEQGSRPPSASSLRLR